MTRDIRPWANEGSASWPVNGLEKLGQVRRGDQEPKIGKEGPG
jgi:hypothetical protein